MELGHWGTQSVGQRLHVSPAPPQQPDDLPPTAGSSEPQYYQTQLHGERVNTTGPQQYQQQYQFHSRRSSTSADEPLDGRSGGSFAAWAQYPLAATGSTAHNSPARSIPAGYTGQFSPNQSPNAQRQSRSCLAPVVRAAVAGAEPEGRSDQYRNEASSPEVQPYRSSGPQTASGGYGQNSYGGGISSSASGGGAQHRGPYIMEREAYDNGEPEYGVARYSQGYGEDWGGEGGVGQAVAYDDGGEGGGGEGGGGEDAAAAAGTYSWPSDPEAMLTLLQQQRQQYRSWVAQCAATALAALDPAQAAAGADLSTDRSGSIPEEVPGMLAAMDCAATVREYLVVLKAAAESVSQASRTLGAFQALTLPDSVPGAADDPADVAAVEAAEAEYVSAAYAVTTAVAAAAGQVAQLREQGGAAAVAGLVQEMLPAGSSSGLEGPLSQKLERVGAELCQRLRQEAEALMSLIGWPPPLADTAAGAAAGGEGGAPGEGPAGGAAGAAAGSGAGADAAFLGFETHPVVSRRLVGVLTALTHFQMAVEQRPVFYQLLAGQGDAGAEGGSDAPSKPLLWAAKALAEPVAAKLRAHFHPAAPTGRLDRPAWLYGTVLEFVRRHGHSLSSLDDMLACLQLKPHYNMPAEFARALQDAVVQQLRDQRIPAICELRNRRRRGLANGGLDANGRHDEDEQDEGEAAAAANGGGDAAAARAEADTLWLGLMDASAAYDIALLPLLGATGPRVEADAAKASTTLSTLAVSGSTGSFRRRACDAWDPTAAGTADMHSRYVAVAAVAAAGAPPPTATTTAAATAAASHLAAWAAAEGAAALRAVEAVLYDDSALQPAEEAASRALVGLKHLEDLAASATPPGGGGSGRAGTGAPWQRDTWPPTMAREVAGVVDGLVARSRWLSVSPLAQRDFLQAAAGPVLAAVRRRLGRLVDLAVARGDVLSEEGLPRVCAALCAAHFLDDHLHSLLVTELAPLVQALQEAAAAATVGGADDAEVSGPGTPSSSVAGGGGAGGGVPAGKLGGSGGAAGFWGGLLAAAGSSSGAVPSSPARVALRDGVTALAAVGSVALSAVGGGGGGSAAAAAAAPVFGEYVRGFSRFHRDACLKVSREVALGFGRHSVLYRHTIEANKQFPFTPEGEDEGAADGLVAGADSTAPAASITPAFAPALLFLQTTLEQLSRCCDKVTFADVWRGAAVSINRFMFNFIATESRFTRAGARQFAADVSGLAQLFSPYSLRRAASSAAVSAGGGGLTSGASFSGGAAPGAAASAAAAAGGQHFRELQAAARLLCLGDEEAADVMRRASAAAVAAQAAAAASAGTPSKLRRAPGTHARGDPVRAGMSSDPVLSSGGLACLSPLQIMNVIEHRI